MSPFRLARLSLLRHRSASFLIIGALALSIACGGMLLRLYELSDSRFQAMGQAGDALVGAKAGGIEILLGSLNTEGEYPGYLPYKLFESLKFESAIGFEDKVVTKNNFIRSITPYVYFAKYKHHRVIGTDKTFLSPTKIRPELKLGSGQWVENTSQIVLGSEVAKETGLNVGDKIQIQPWVGGKLIEQNLEFSIQGILAPTQTQWDTSLFSSVEEAHRVFSTYPANLMGRSIWGPQVLNYFLVDLEPNGFPALEALVNGRTVAQAVLVEQQKERLQELSGVGRNVGLLVTAFVILLAGLSVAAMMITRFEGMRFQFAVLRAIGYTKIQLLICMFWEALMLSFAGVVIGAAIDFTIFPILRSLLGQALPPVELVNSQVTESLPIWMIAILATIIAVLVPMRKMATQDAHSALRGF